MQFGIIADILKKLVAWQVLTPLYDSCEPVVFKINGVLDATLAAKLKTYFSSVNVHMSVFQCCQTERTVFARVLFVTDADGSDLEKTHDGGQHFFPWEAGKGQIALHPLTYARQDSGESNHSVVLARVADLAPARVITVLFPPFRIATGGLKMTIFQHANPNVSPSGWNRQGFYSFKFAVIANNFAAR